MFTKILIYLAILVGVIAFFGLFTVLFANSLEVQCARTPDGAPTCKISKALLGKVPISSRTISNVVSVKEDESCDADTGCSYRALLITSSGQSVPVDDVYTDAGPVQEQMDSINAFLSGQTDSFDYAADVPWWVVSLIGGLGLMTVLILAVSFVSQLLKRN